MVSLVLLLLLTFIISWFIAEKKEFTTANIFLQIAFYLLTVPFYWIPAVRRGASSINTIHDSPDYTFLTYFCFGCTRL